MRGTSRGIVNPAALATLRCTVKEPPYNTVVRAPVHRQPYQNLDEAAAARYASFLRLPSRRVYQRDLTGLISVRTTHSVRQPRYFIPLGPQPDNYHLQSESALLF